MSKTIFSLIKIPILSHKPSYVGVQPKHKHFNKTLLFYDCESKLRYKDRGCKTDVTFIRPISVLHGKILYPRYSSPVTSRPTPRMVIRHMTPDFAEP